MKSDVKKDMTNAHLACHTKEARWQASKTKMLRLLKKLKKEEKKDADK